MRVVRVSLFVFAFWLSASYFRSSCEFSSVLFKMSLLPSFSVDPELSEALVELERDFHGIEVEIASSSSDDELSSTVVQALSSNDEDDADLEHYLELEFDTDAAAANYFDQPSATGDLVPQVAEAAAQPATPSCGCSKTCLSKLDSAEVEQMQLNFAEAEKSELDLLIIGLLQSCKYSGSTTSRGNKRKHQYYRYSFQGEEICAGAFRYLYSIGVKQLKNIKKHLEDNGPVQRIHGNVGKRPKHALSFSAVSNVVKFMKSYAEQFGIPHPAPLHGRAGTPTTYLPASSTVVTIHKSYVASCTVRHLQCELWGTIVSVRYGRIACLMPHVEIMSPRIDVCSHCESHRRRIQETRTDAEKLAACDAFKEHVAAAQAERDVYRKATVDAKAELDATEELPAQGPCSRDLHNVHYTLDYARNVALAQSARQEGPLYFKAPRKVHILGVNNEAVTHQVNYLIDKADTIGQDGKTSHGPNSVASMMHHYFAKHGMQEKGCHLHCDNCGGRNKNRTITAYLCWRVLMGLHQRIELSFMVTGHTRCLVDGCFGLLKQKFRHSDIYTMKQLETVVNDSAACNHAQLIPGSDLEWRAWGYFPCATFQTGERNLANTPHGVRFGKARRGELQSNTG
eukprot:scpid48468/ scgid2473/ 